LGRLPTKGTVCGAGKRTDVSIIVIGTRMPAHHAKQVVRFCPLRDLFDAVRVIVRNEHRFGIGASAAYFVRGGLAVQIWRFCSLTGNCTFKCLGERGTRGLGGYFCIRVGAAVMEALVKPITVFGAYVIVLERSAVER